MNRSQTLWPSWFHTCLGQIQGGGGATQGTEVK